MSARPLAAVLPILMAVTALSAGTAAASETPAMAEAEPAPTLVVATDGDDTNPGTVGKPLRTIQKAVDLAEPGDVIALRGGRYLLRTNVQITHSGTAEKPITLTNYQDERAVIDGEKLPASHTPPGGDIPRPERGAIHQEASYWHVSDLEIVNGPYAYYCDGCNHNVFDSLVTHDNYESGFQLQGESSHNLIVNLDSYGNRDPRKYGESADGLAIKEGSGEGNVVRGARLWNNVDDGFDAWEFLSPVVLEDTVTWGNGYNRWNFPNFQGDGNGFKLGGGDEVKPADHVVRNSISFGNKASGYVDNGNPGELTLIRTTAYNNEGTGYDLDDCTSVLTKNLAVGNGAEKSLGSTTANGNSWQVGGPWDDKDLASVDPATISGPRPADGGIPASDFLEPNNGVDVGARF